MLIRGSCSCGAVKFEAQSNHPVPYQRCYCTICTKTQGGGGYCINTSADASSLRVEGTQNLRVYQAMIERAGELHKSKHERHFCQFCGSHLWAFHEDWPHLIHPVAGALDTELPPPAENVHLMLGSKQSWCTVEGKPGDERYDEYPHHSIARFHDQRGWTVE